jgi:hypothetical protein
MDWLSRFSNGSINQVYSLHIAEKDLLPGFVHRFTLECERQVLVKNFHGNSHEVIDISVT